MAATRTSKTGTSARRKKLPDATPVTGDLTVISALTGVLGSGPIAADPSLLAEGLLRRFGSLNSVLDADHEQLLRVPGMTEGAANILKIVDWMHRCRTHGEAPSVPTVAPVAARIAHVARRKAGGSGARTIRSPQSQPELPMELAEQPELIVDHSPAGSPSPRDHKTIQDVLFDEGLLALKLAPEAKTMDELQASLQTRLGQNSAETRRRYSQYILRWFFPDGLAGPLPGVWMAYRDDGIAIDLMRWSYLNNEPIMGQCVAEALFPCENGLVIPASYFDRFLQEHMGEATPDKTRKRLKSNLKKIGFLERAKGKPDRLLPVACQKTSFLILLHYLFACKAIRTVELGNLFANPFWKYLGYKSEDAVRSVLREADSAGLVGKYVVADQLEQVTTCFTLDELLAKKARL